MIKTNIRNKKKYPGVIDNGNGTVTLDFRDNQHKRHQKTIRGTAAQGYNILLTLKTKMQDEIFYPERVYKKITFNEAADIYWKIHGSIIKSAPKLVYTINTIKEYFRDKTIASLTPEDIQVFYNQIMTKTSPSTANRHFTALRAIINKMIKLKKYKGYNPCADISRKKDNPARETYLTKPQIIQLLDAAPERSKGLFAFAIATGMRRGEILQLDWSEIDLDANIIHIYKSKSGKAREVPIMTPLKNMLLAMKPKKSGKVFEQTIPMIKYDFKYTLKKTSITNVRFHDLRHTFASHFVMNGGSISDLQRILGHYDIKLTMRYAHLSPNYLRKSIEIAKDLLPQYL